MPAPNPTTIRLDPSTRADLEALASRLRTTRAAVIRRAVQELAERVLMPAAERREGGEHDDA